MHIMSPTWARSPFLQFTRATMHTGPWLYWRTVCTEAGYVAISLRWFSQNQKENLDVRYPVVGMSSFSLALFTTVVFFGLACSFSFLTSPFSLSPFALPYPCRSPLETDSQEKEGERRWAEPAPIILLKFTNHGIHLGRETPRRRDENQGGERPG